MAHSNSNQADLCKFLCCILFSILFHCDTCEEYYIVPSQSFPCKVGYENCLTFREFVSSFTNCSKCSNTTLIFAPGNHSLESDLIIEDVHSFFMFAEPFSSTPQIICSLNTKFEFRNINTVTIDGLDFIECSGNQLELISQFHLTDSTFNIPAGVDGTTLTIAESTIHLDRVAFLSGIESAQDLTVNTLRPQENCTLNSTTMYRILTSNSVIVITQSLFDGSVMGVGTVISSEIGSEITIFNSTFKNNRATCCSTEICVGAVLSVSEGIITVYDSKFEYNHGTVFEIIGGVATFTHCVFSNHLKLFDDIDDKTIETMVFVHDSNLSIKYSTFTKNAVPTIKTTSSNANIAFNAFTNNSGQILMHFVLTNMTSLYHNELANNTVCDLIYLNRTDKVSISLNEFVNNKVNSGLIASKYDIQPENYLITNNIFIDNSAIFDVYINSMCEPGLTLSLGSSRCIKCPEDWYLNLVGLILAAFIAGILLVILMLALNLTVAVGSLNGILFYANIVDFNMNAYFPLSSTPNFVTVLVSWLNLGIGFDICAYDGMGKPVKAVLQLAFSAYVVILVIIVIIISERSTKFARIVGKGDPVAVLATMILLSFTKLFKAVIGSITLIYFQPAYGSRNIYPTNFIALKPDFTVIGKALFVISSLVGVLCLLYAALVFFWKWLVQCQNKIVFRWVRYQKLQHFMEPYQAPYTAKYRYWTGLLLIVRITLFGVSAINFTRDPRVDFVSTIFVIGCLILFRAVMVKRLYKNALLDVLEIIIYFNLVFFAAFTWYSLDFGGNQLAVAYVSVLITFSLLLAVIVFHLVRFTCLYRLACGRRSLQGMTTKLIENSQAKDEDEPDVLDGVLMQRAKPKSIPYSVIEISSN